MEIKKLDEIEEEIVETERAKNVKMQILTKGAGNFIMRRIIVGKDGYTALHRHAWEHEVYILNGKGTVLKEGKKIKVEKGTTIYVPPNEEHQFLNKGDDNFEFICVIPFKDKACKE